MQRARCIVRLSRSAARTALRDAHVALAGHEVAKGDGAACSRHDACVPAPGSVRTDCARSRKRLRRDRNAKESVLFDDMGQKLLEAKLIDETALQKAQLQQKNSGGSLTGS